MSFILFCFFSILAVIFSILVVIQRKAIYSALFLIVVLCCFAGLYVLIGATFVAAIQVIVYAGAIMVLFVFIIWFLGLRTGEEPAYSKIKWFYIIPVIGIIIGVQILYIIIKYLKGYTFQRTSDIKGIANVMLGKYVLPFELTSILFLVALVGAFYIARSKKKELDEKEEKKVEIDKDMKKKKR